MELLAQKFYASPEKIEVGERDIFEVSYVLENASANDFQAPAFNDFTVMGGPNKSTSMQIMNGSMSSSLSISFSLQPKHIGTFTIPAATITTDKKQTLRSGKIVVTVSKGSHNTSPRGGGNRRNPFGGGQSMPFPFPNTPTLPSPQSSANETIDLFMRIITDTVQVYQGEQVTASFRIYTNSDVADFNLRTPPTFTGFWVEDITDKGSTKSHQEKINGKTYTAFDAKRYALFPQQTGRFVLEPVEADVSVQVADPAWGSFFARTEVVSLRSDSTVVTVNELPLNNKPSDFSGAVGVFTLNADANTNNLKTGEVFTLNITIAGEGNIKLLQAPDIAFPSMVEAYDPQVAEDIFTKMDKINGRRSFEYHIMPLKTGETSIPPVSFSYYDTKLHRYETLSTQAIPLRIAQGTNPVPTQPDNNDVSESNKPKPIWQYLLPLISIALAIYGISYWYKKKQVAQKPKDTYVAALENYTKTKRKADHPLIIALQTAETNLNKGNTRQFYDELHSTLSTYLTRKYGIKPANLTTQYIRQALLNQNIAEPDANAAAQIMQQCEIALFAPIALNATEARLLYDQTIKLINNLEQLA